MLLRTKTWWYFSKMCMSTTDADAELSNETGGEYISFEQQITLNKALSVFFLHIIKFHVLIGFYYGIISAILSMHIHLLQFKTIITRRFQRWNEGEPTGHLKFYHSCLCCSRVWSQWVSYHNFTFANNFRFDTHTHTHQIRNIQVFFLTFFSIFKSFSVSAILRACALQRFIWSTTKTKAEFTYFTREREKIANDWIFFLVPKFPIEIQSIDSIISVRGWSSRFESFEMSLFYSSNVFFLLFNILLVLEWCHFSIVQTLMMFGFFFLSSSQNIF